MVGRGWCVKGGRVGRLVERIKPPPGVMLRPGIVLWLGVVVGLGVGREFACGVVAV